MAGEDQNIGDVTPRSKSKGFYIMIAIAAAVLIGGVMMFSGGDDPPANGAANPNPTAPITIPQLQSSVDSLNATVAGFAGRLATLESQAAPTVTQTDIDALQANINSLAIRLDELNATIANLDGTGNGNGTIYTGEISRWDFDSLTVLGCTDDYTFEVVSKSPSRIEEEDLYEITVEITNENVVIPTGRPDPDVDPTAPNITTLADIDRATIALNHELEIIISPRDYCMVNDLTTYLDSDSYPYLSWDADFVTRTREGQEVCRRITFTTEVYNFGNLLLGESLELDLVFELYYS